MIIVLWFDWVSSVLLFNITSIIGIHFFMKTSKPNNHSKHFAIFSHFLFITSLFRFSESQMLHKPIYNKWSFWSLWFTLWVNLLPFTACSHMKNNLHFGICDKQQSPQDSLALMVATAHRYLSRTQSYIFHKYDLSNACKEYILQQSLGPVDEYVISYNCFFL